MFDRSARHPIVRDGDWRLRTLTISWGPIVSIVIQASSTRAAWTLDMPAWGYHTFDVTAHTR